MDLNISVMNMTCGLDLPVRSRLARCLSPEPPDSAEENYHRDNQSRIARRNSHVTKHQDVTKCHQQHRHHNDVKRAIHTVTSFDTRAFMHLAGTALSTCPSPTPRCP